MLPLWDERYTEADAKLIHQMAKHMVGHYGYRTSDIHDLEQDLAMHVFQRAHRYQPARGSRKKFVSKVAKNKLLHLIEHRTARKRDGRGQISGDALGWDNASDRGARSNRWDLSIDVREVILQLSSDLRRVALLLQQQHTVKEIGDLLNLSRGQVRWRIRQIGAALCEAGLDQEFSLQQPSPAQSR